MATTVAEAAVLIKALGVDAVKRDLQKLEGAFKNAMRTPAGADKAMDPIRRRIALHAEGLRHESTRAAALAKLEQWEARLNKQLAAGNASYGQRIALETQLKRIQSTRTSALAPAVPGMAPGAKAPGMLGRMAGVGGAVAGTLSSFGVVLGGMAAVRGVGASNAAFDAHEQSMRKLAATAKITGVPLETLNRIAADGVTKFRLSAVTANDFAIEIAKLTAKAGDIGLAGAALENFLNIGAARGFSPAETLQAIQQAILGIDEGTDKLFGANPSALYAQYAAAIGTTAGKLTDEQKAMALVVAAQKDGSKVRGELEAFYLTAAGRSFLLAQAQEKMALAFGTALLPIRELVTDYLLRFSEWMVANQPTIIAVGKLIGGLLTISFGTLGDAVLTIVDVVSMGWNLFVSGIQSGAAKILQAAGMIIGGLGKLAGVVPGMGDLAGKWSAAGASMSATGASLDASASARRDAAWQTAKGIGTRTVGTVKRVGTAFSSSAGGAVRSSTSGFTMGATSGGGGGAGTVGGGGGSGGGMALGNLLGGRSPQALQMAANAAVPTSMAPVTLAIPISPKLQLLTDRMNAEMAAIGDASLQFGAAFGQTLTSAFAGGIQAAISEGSIGAGFAAFGEILLSGLGGALIQFGTAAVMTSSLMLALQTALQSFLPGGGIVAGLAMIALGAAISGAASAAFGGMGKKGGGGRGGGGGGVSFGDSTSTLTLGSRGVPAGTASQTVTPRTGASATVPTGQQVVVNQTIIGARDPRIQRELAAAAKYGRGRNL